MNESPNGNDCQADLVANAGRRSPIRFRFSILSLMLTAAVVGLAISLWQTSLTLDDARKQLRHLREKYHLLAPDDPSKISVLFQETHFKGEWEWRIVLPDVWDEYELVCQVGDLPLDGTLPDSGNRVRLPAGEEYLVTIRLQPTSDGHWELSLVGAVMHESGFAFRRSPSLPLSAEQVWWMEYDCVSLPAAPRGELFRHRDSSSERLFYPKITGIFFEEQFSYSPENPLILFEQRIFEYDEKGNSVEAKQPEDGMMIWIQRAKPFKQSK